MGSIGSVLDVSPLISIDSAIDALATEDLTSLTSSALADDLVSLHRLVERLQAQLCRRVAHFERTQGFAVSGHLSMAAWLRHRCRLHGGAAGTLSRTSRHLEDLPQTEAAFASGEISYAHANVIARTSEQIGPEPVRQTESDLVEAARQLDPSDLAKVTDRLRFLVDQDGVLEDANQSRLRRWLHISRTLDGIYYLNGRLDREAGELVATAIEAYATPMTNEDRRSAAQRRADALTEVCRRHLDSGQQPIKAGQKPHLELVVTLDVLRGQAPSSPGQLRGPGSVSPAWRGEMEPATLNGHMIPTETARRIACDATLVPVLVDEKGNVLDVGRARRTISPAQRRALNRRDGHCRYPGCDRPTSWCEGHHIKHWVDGGESKLKNFLLFCKRHHVFVHEHGGRVVITPDGEIHVEMPDPWNLPP